MLLERLLSNLSVEVEPFAVCEIETGCQLSLPPSDEVTLHYVLAGEGTITVGSTTMTLGKYTLALVSGGHRQVVAGIAHDADGSGLETAPEGLDHMIAGRPGAPGLLIACGHLDARYALRLDVFRLMPPIVTIDFSDNTNIRTVFDRILAESGRPEPGSRAMLRALMNGCLVEIFRALCESDSCDLPWLDALEDERMAPVIETVVRFPEKDYSVEYLATIAGMSRSAFAATFTEVFGRGPMSFVRETRMRHAAELLTVTTDGVDNIARRVGYASRTHFSAVFKDYFGVSPTEFRRREATRSVPTMALS